MKRKREEPPSEVQVRSEELRAEEAIVALAQDALAKDTEEQTARLAMHLYLEPWSVLTTCTYWLSQYSDYMSVTCERECFNALVAGLLRRRPQLSLCGCVGVGRSAQNVLCFQGEMQFAGTRAHRIPMEHFARSRVGRVVSSMAALLRPQNKCFVTRNADGLDGELSLRGFKHCAILERFYEPSFMVITLFLLHLLALVGATNCPSAQEREGWEERHQFSLQAIDATAQARITCFDAGDEHYEERMARCRSDLSRLHRALNTSDHTTALERARELWRDKACDCYENMLAYIDGTGDDDE
jgi:hypothetical protein